jgi:branched-chain amino acid transport system permease protein
VTRFLPVLLLAAALIAVPAFADSFQLTLVTQGIAWGMVGLSVWLLLRFLELPSFGHAAFFGVGAYAAGLAITRWDIENVFIALALAVALSCAVAVPIALIAARLNSISFLLVTLAFAEMLHAVARRWDTVGGTDGLVGILRPSADPLPIDLTEPATFYYLALGLLAVALVVLLVVRRSPFGGALVGIRESPERMAALGYNAIAYRVAAFVLSAAIAGAAGGINAYLNRFADPGDLSPLISARGLLIAVIGGASLLGPPIAAIALTELEDALSSFTDRWLGLLGLVYVFVALLAVHELRPGAAWSRLRGRFTRAGARRTARLERHT